MNTNHGGQGWPLPILVLSSVQFPVSRVQCPVSRVQGPVSSEDCPDALYFSAQGIIALLVPYDRGALYVHHDRVLKY